MVNKTTIEYVIINIGVGDMEIAVIDDFDYDRKKLQGIINYYLNVKNIDCVICMYDSAEAFLQDFPRHIFTMIFLDISMSGMTGMQAAREIRKQDKRIPIVFATVEKDFALEGYEVHAAGFVLKPFAPEKVYAVLDHVLSDMITPQYISIKESRVTVQILLDNLYFVEMRNHYAEFHTSTGIHHSYMTFDGLRNLIPEQLRFQCCCRGIIVNFDNVKRIEEQTIVFQNDERVPVSRSKKIEIRNAYASYAFEKTRRGAFYEP